MPFLRYRRRSVARHLLHEDEHFLVILDIYPIRPAHVLLVSREHAPHLSDLPLPARERLVALAERVQRALRACGHGRDGINIMINDGPASNQHVPHFHLHLVPRRLGDLPWLLWRMLTRFLPLGRKTLQRRLEGEADALRQALQREA